MLAIAVASCEPSLPGNSVAQDQVDWAVYSGDSNASQYSTLKQIDLENVSQLKLAWSYASAEGAAIPVASELQVNPLIVNGILYGRNPNYNVFAIDAYTGEALWTHQPDAQYAGLSYMRGLTMWKNGDSSRLFFSTGHWLYSIDAKNGKPITTFGKDGAVDLREGLGRNPSTVSINAPSPGVIFDKLLIMGSAVLESEGAAPGDVRAYHVETGELVWSFHTIPRPGELGADTWPAEFLSEAGGANSWAGMSVDQGRGLVFVPTGSPTPDFLGSKREGKNLFANSVIALDARSGDYRWHFQTVHHDLWDRDLSSAPTLATINRNGKEIDVVAQASKQGVLYVLDRENGSPIFPIVEQAVSTSDVPNQHNWPTQPKVLLPEPFSRQTFSADDLSDINEETHAYVKKLFEQTEKFEYFGPINTKKTILFPGFYGGGNWGGGAFDPETDIYYINGTEVPALVNFNTLAISSGTDASKGKLTFVTQCSGCHGMELRGFYPYAPELRGISSRLTREDALKTISSGKGRMMSFAHLPSAARSDVVDFLFDLDRSLSSSKDSSVTETTAAAEHSEYVFGGYTDFLDQRYYPAVKPPWGTLNSINLSTGKLLWQIPLGEHKELSAEGIPPTGTRNYGGPVVTAGGLIIIAATMDEMLRVFNKHNGELLWEYKLPAAGYATPATYSVNGKQFIVIAAPGGKLGTQSGDQYLAFSLP
ncbi:MAG: PQQ-binding-like beta-propeller repeat protein [Pseudomonadales bacterium]